MTIALKQTGGKPPSVSQNEYMTKLQAICGEPSLLPSEDREAYCALRDAIAGGISPRDGVEAVWVQELTDMTWEGWRRKKLKPAFLRVAIPRAISELLRTASERNYGDNLAADYVNGSPREKRRTEAELAAMGYGPDEINAKAFEYSLYELTQLERLDAATDARRVAILREIDRHRAWAASPAAAPPVEQTQPAVGGGP
jgi:hypothetical protein